MTGREIASSALSLAVSKFWRKQQLKLVNMERVDIFCILVTKITKFFTVEMYINPLLHMSVAVGMHNAIVLLYVRVFWSSMIRQQYIHVAAHNAVC